MALRATVAAGALTRARAARRGRVLLRALAAAALALPLAGCVGPETAPTAERAVRFPLSGDLTGLDFARATDSNTLTVAALVSEPLVGFDDRLRIVPAAARRWSWSDDRTRLTIELRPELHWHDGRPVTAEDVVHTWRVATDPSTGDPGRAALFNLVTDVVAEDPHTAVVQYARPFSPALSNWATLPLLPAHLPLGTDPPVGCGRFVFERWDHGERVVLRANPDHPDGPPSIGRLELEVLPDYATRLSALESGRIDAAPVIPQHWQQVRSDERFMTRYEVKDYRVLFYWYLAWRMDGSNPFFEDARVRRAMTHAVDRTGYVRRFGDAPDRAPVTSFHPDGWASDPTIEPWAFDPQRAAALLEEAGWIDGDGDGVRDRAGRAFRFRLTYARSSAENDKIAAFVQDGLRRVGIAAELEPLEYSVFLDRLRARTFEAVMGGIRLDPDPDPYDLWHSSQAASGRNHAGLRDPEVDAWIERARETFDREARRRLYSLVERRLHEMEPLTVFFYPTSRLAVSRELAGVTVGPNGPLRPRPGPAAWHWRTGGAR